MIKNNDRQYGVVAKIFHWLLFVLLTFSIIAGNIMVNMPKGAEKWEAIAMHKSFGAVILMLVFLRLLWRLINTQPKEEVGAPVIQNKMASAMHYVLYALMFAQPFTGMLMSQAAGYPVSFFGMFEFPSFLTKNPDLADLFNTAHGIIWIVLVLAVIGHAGAALYHHFIQKDNTLKKMTTGL